MLLSNMIILVLKTEPENEWTCARIRETLGADKYSTGSVSQALQYLYANDRIQRMTNERNPITGYRPKRVMRYKYKRPGSGT